MILLPGSFVAHDWDLLNSIAWQVAGLGLTVVVQNIPAMIERGDIKIVDGEVSVRKGLLEEQGARTWPKNAATNGNDAAPAG